MGTLVRERGNEFDGHRVDTRRDEFRTLLASAARPQLFGSVARGAARMSGDIDIFPVQLLEEQMSRTALKRAWADIAAPVLC